MKDIYILHENAEWVVPLKAAFAKRGVEPKEWFLDEGQVNFDKAPPNGIFYNRMSASSHTRGHRFAPELTRVALTWLEQHKRTVINGTQALYLEVCKISQYAALNQAGVKTPATRAVVGKAHLLDAANEFNHWPLIIKPNRGGKGLGVQLMQNPQALQAFIEGTDFETPLDGLWLLQQYIQPQQKFITRCEFVGGEFVYAVNVNTEQGFELCPADVCAIDDGFCPTTAQPQNKFKITDQYNQHPVIAKLQACLKNAHVDIAGIEIICDQQGEVYAYDINTNTNYNGQAESEAQVTLGGMDAVAAYLIKLSEQ